MTKALSVGTITQVIEAMVERQQRNALRLLIPDAVRNRPGPDGTMRIAPAKQGYDEKDERRCNALCRDDEGVIVHRVGCRVGIVEHNTQVDNRQVRRAYARTMKKRGS